MAGNNDAAPCFTGRFPNGDNIARLFFGKKRIKRLFVKTELAHNACESCAEKRHGRGGEFVLFECAHNVCIG